MTQNPSPACRVFVVDDHPLVREGFKALLAQQHEFAVCGEADDVRGAMAAIAQAEPDLVVVDIPLKNSDGLELVRRLAARSPGTAILVCTIYDAAIYAERALAAGAKGYISKRAPADEFLTAFRQIREGKIYLSDQMANLVLTRTIGGKPNSAEQRIASLSDRELEVFRMIGMGKTTAEIARSLNLSPKTIETHRLRIRAKLGLADSIKLVREATEFVLQNPVAG